MVRLHAFVFNFKGDSSDLLSSKLRNIKGQDDLLSCKLGMKKSIYLNNKQLGDEICYVLDRKNQKKFIGNTLEKPNILLKKTFTRDTNFD